MKCFFAILLALGLAASIQAGAIGNFVSGVKTHAKEDIQLIKTQVQQNIKTAQNMVQENIKAVLSGDIPGAIKTITKNGSNFVQDLGNQAIENAKKFTKDAVNDVKTLNPFGNKAAPAQPEQPAQPASF